MGRRKALCIDRYSDLWYWNCICREKVGFVHPEWSCKGYILSLISSSVTDDGDGEAKSSKVANPDSHKPN